MPEALGLGADGLGTKEEIGGGRDGASGRADVALDAQVGGESGGVHPRMASTAR
jgi:hypothetical protein